MEPNIHANRGAFPVDQPIQALLRDHDMVRQLADAYRKGHSEAVKKEAASKIVTLLEIHSRLEESVFYPAVRNVDATMIGHFEEEH